MIPRIFLTLRRSLALGLILSLIGQEVFGASLPSFSGVPGEIRSSAAVLEFSRMAVVPWSYDSRAMTRPGTAHLAEEAAAASRTEPEATLWRPSRRGFLSRVARWAPFFLLARWGMADGYREGVGRVYTQPISFQPFNPGVLENPETRIVLDSMATYIGQIKAAVSLMQRNQLTVEQELAIQDQRIELGNILISQSGVREAMDRQLQKIGIPFSDNPDIRLTQVLYAGLPAYLAARGIYISFTSPRPFDPRGFAPELWQHPIFETINLYPVDKVEHSSLTLWGTPTQADELSISGPLRVGGVEYSMATGGLNGQNAYGNIILYEQGLAESFTASKKGDIPSETIYIQIQQVEWETAMDRSPAFRADPLGFAHARMVGEGMLHPESDAVRKARIRLAVRLHERQHWLDFLRGLYPARPTPTNWTDYNRLENGEYIRQEMDAELSSARHVPPEYRRAALRYFLNILEDSIADKLPITDRLVYYNLIDMMLTHLAAHWKEYPELKIQVRRDISLRGQIAGQLYRLTPQSLARVFDAMHAERVRNPTAIHLPPTPVSRTALVAGPPYVGPPPAAAPKKENAPGRRAFFAPLLVLVKNLPSPAPADPYTQGLVNTLIKLWDDTEKPLSSAFERGEDPYKHLVIDRRNPKKPRYFIHLHFQHGDVVYATGLPTPSSLAELIEIKVHWYGISFGELMLEEPHYTREYVSVMDSLPEVYYRRTVASVRTAIEPALSELKKAIRTDQPRITNILEPQKNGRFRMVPRPGEGGGAGVQNFEVVAQPRRPDSALQWVRTLLVKFLSVFLRRPVSDPLAELQSA